jgi:hypothetical protein
LVLRVAHEAEEKLTADFGREEQGTALQKLRQLGEKLLFHLLSEEKWPVDVGNYID